MARKTKRPGTTTHIVPPGSTVRIEQPHSTRGQKKDVSVIEIVQEVNPASGFVDFLREQAVVGVAIGFIIGFQAQTFMKQFVSSFVDPMFTLFFGQKLASRTSTLSLHDRSVVLAWGSFIYAFLSFVFFLLVVYLFFKFFRLEKLAKSQEDKKK
jgi:large-conductance mechanosensitive channel